MTFTQTSTHMVSHWHTQAKGGTQIPNTLGGRERRRETDRQTDRGRDGERDVSLGLRDT